MPRRQGIPFSLKRKRIRTSFNKLNVYNALTWDKNRPLNTQYRQVFFAKQETRSYHGEHLTETQFRNIFRSELTSVSPLESKAASAGKEDTIPHALQTYVALERRLDFAVFRAMFASSVRQAAQFIVGGAVKVNGVKIKQPGYTLQRGDLFTVDPNRVLEALGRQKPALTEAIEQTNKIIRKFNRYVDQCQKNPEKMWKLRDARRKRHLVFNQKYQAKEETRVASHNAEIQKKMNAALDRVGPKSILESILKGDTVGTSEQITGKTKAVLGLVQTTFPSARFGTETIESPPAEQTTSQSEPSEPLAAAPSEVAAAPSESAQTQSEPQPDAPATTKPLESATAPQTEKSSDGDSDATTIVDRYFGQGVAPPGRGDVKKLVSEIAKLKQDDIRNEHNASLLTANGQKPYDPKWVERLPAKVAEIPAEATLEEIEKLKLALPFSTTGKIYGLSEPEKRWFTPWTPRPFVAPFAVLPHHLEISFETCNAVYLRDPVARPGHSEIISPFSLDMHERAHMWYFYRRRKFLRAPNSQ